LLVLVIGVAASFFVFFLVRDSVESVARLRFEREANDAHGIIEDRLRSYADVLYGLRALFASQGTINRLQFHRFIESLDLKHRYPAFDSFNYALYVPAKDKQRFEEAVRRDTSLDPRGYPHFAVHPTGQRPEYFVVVYLEPMAGYEFAFGLDLGMNRAAADPEKVANAARAGRDSGELTASGQPLRVGNTTVLLAMRVAVYRDDMPVETVEQKRAAYLGSVGAAFNVGNMMKGALNEELLRYVRIKLYDAGPVGADPNSASSEARSLLFDSEQLTKEPGARANDVAESDFIHVLPLEIAGRHWDFQYSAPKSAIISRLDKIWPPWVLVGGLTVSVLLSGVLYFLASSRGRAVALANEITKDLRESQTQLQALSRRLVEVQELERRRLSSELHDRVGQNLTAMSINLDILKSKLPAEGNGELKSRLEDSTHLLESTADTIDNVMSELRPPMLDDYGLLAALKWHTKDFSRRTGIDVTVRGEETRTGRTPELEITLFRIAQEALNNVAKHAHAQHVVIALETRENECIMSVWDDGKGLDMEASATRTRSGLGMVTMRERAQAVGGRFDARSTPENGTQVTVRIPR
jgi:signal transduction histidine kinase